MAMMQMTRWSVVVTMRAVLVGKDDLRCFRQQFIHSHLFSGLGLGLSCFVYTESSALFFCSRHTAFSNSYGVVGSVEFEAIMVYATSKIPCE